jgi:hypothetical protein
MRSWTQHDEAKRDCPGEQVAGTSATGRNSDPTFDHDHQCAGKWRPHTGQQQQTRNRSHRGKPESNSGKRIDHKYTFRDKDGYG